MGVLAASATNKAFKVNRYRQVWIFWWRIPEIMQRWVSDIVRGSAAILRRNSRGWGDTRFLGNYNTLRMAFDFVM